MNADEQTKLLLKITDHLKLMEDKQDDFNGIILAVYETEVKNLSEKVIATLSRLIEKGIVNESKSQNGKCYYQLIQDKKIDEYLRTL